MVTTSECFIRKKLKRYIFVFIKNLVSVSDFAISVAICSY